MRSDHTGDEDRARACILMETILLHFRGSVDNVRLAQGEAVQVVGSDH